MDRHGQKGSITVFFSLTCVLFLSLICAAVESARVQGARAQTANITGIGTFSLLGEFERELLEQYGIFSLDSTYGSGSFRISKAEERLKGFLSCNVNPQEELLSAVCFDPWNLELEESKITGYALLTDQRGEPFYQQAVACMKKNIGTIAVEKLMDYVQDAEKISKWQETYEENKKDNDSEMSGLEKEKQQKLEELESEAEASGTDSTAVVLPEEPQSNPLKEIAKLRKKSTLELVTWDKEISGKRINTKSLPSRDKLQKGTMKLENEYSGLTSDILFREYLLRYFPEYLSGKKGKALDYQIEYLLGGKDSDEANLKYVVTRLLLLREGMNYLYCLQDQGIGAEAGTLAVTLTGWTGIPALTTATKHALLLAWAYGESLLDVRILLDNGKVPVVKDSTTWALSLENLGRISELLSQGGQNKGKGLSYPEYLRILLYMGSREKQKMRALDMIQAELQSDEKTGSFRAKNCIVAVQTGTNWYCRPVFLRLPQVIMGTSAADVRITQKASMGYQ